MTTRHPLRQDGFTLIELMAVLFILSLIMAIVLPNFATEKSKLRSSVQQMSSIIRYTNESAALTKQSMRMAFNFKNKQLSWETSEGSKSAHMKWLKSIELQSTGKVTEGELTIYFGPGGLTEHMWIYMGNESRDYTIEYNPISGRVKVF